MKKILSFIVLLAGVTMFTSCGEDDATYTAPIPLEVSDVNVLFESEGGTGTISLRAKDPVTATTESSWLTLAVNGNTVTATATANPSLVGRSAKINLKSGNAVTSVTATQKGSVYGLAGGILYSIADTLNAYVNIPIVHSSGVMVWSLTDWLKASFNEETDEIEVVASSNEEESPRLGFVAFETGIIKDTIFIYQQGMVFTIETQNITMTNQGGNQNIAVQCSKNVVIESTVDWITATYNSKNSQIQLKVEANPGDPRRGVVKVTSGSKTKEIVVSQFESEQMFGEYIFGFYDEDGESGFYATLTENALTIDQLGWAIPVTVNKENMTVSIQSGSFVGTYSSYFIYLLFMDENEQYWTGSSTTATSTATLGLVDIGDGEVTLAGDFGGTFGTSNIPVGAFLFSAFSEQNLDISDDGPYLGDLLTCYGPSLMKIPEGDGGEMAKAKRVRTNSVPLSIKRRR